MPGSQVPTPYAAHRHPYPTRFHGGIWKRPVFGLPYIHKVQNVIRPVEFYSQYGSRGETVYAGLGNLDKQGPLPVVLNQGLFRTRGQGGGIFNQVLAGTGLGDTTGTLIAFALGAAAGVLLAKYGPKALRPNASITLLPAYGRDYKSKAAIQADLDANKDFILSDFGSRWDGKPINREQILEAYGPGKVIVRYAKQRKVTQVDVRK